MADRSPVSTSPSRQNRHRHEHLGGRFWLVFSALPILILLNPSALAADPAGAPTTSAELFQVTKVWSVHLTFTPEQWAAMEPKRAVGGLGPGAFGSGMFFGPALFAQADADDDGVVSRAEFHALAERWFDAWDKAKSGTLNGDQLRAGLNAAFAPPPGAQPAMPNILRGPEGKRNGLASALGIEFEYAHADVEFEGKRLADVGVRYKGNGTYLASQGSLKRSMKVDLNRFVDGQKLAGQTKLNLHSNVTDAGWMNEVLSHRLYRDAGVPAPRTAYARVYLTVPGKHDRKYVGLYSIVEEVGKSFAAERFGGGGKAGAIFKPVTPALFADLGDKWSKYKQSYDPKTEVTEAQTRRVIEFARLVTRAGDDEFAARLGEFLDVDEFARFMAVTTWLSAMDSILATGQNFYLRLDPRTERFQFIPWDLDHSFGHADFMGNQAQRENLSIQHPWVGGNRFLERVFKVEAFKKAYLARLEEVNNDQGRPERLKQQVDELAAALRPAVQEESAAMLARFDKVVAGQPASAVPPGGAGLTSVVVDLLKKPPKPIAPFAQARTRSVADQLAGKSQGQTVAGFGMAPGGGGGGGGGGRDGADRRGPGNFLAPGFMSAMDANKDKQITREEFLTGFDRWFAKWDREQTGRITDQQLRAGLDKDLPFSFFGGMGPGGSPEDNGGQAPDASPPPGSK